MSKATLVKKATVLQDIYKYVTKDSSFLGNAAATTGTAFNGVVKLFSTSPKDSFMKLVDPKSDLAFSAMTPALMALGMNTAITMHTGATAVQDLRRVNNMSLEKSDFYTSFDDAYTTLALSGTAAVLGTAPAISATTEVMGEFLNKNGGAGQTRTVVGKGLKAAGKVANLPSKAFFKGSEFVGKGLDGTINTVAALFGKDLNVSGFQKVLGKHFMFVPLLSTAAFLYRKFTIDMTKNQNDTLSNLKVAGKYVFRDNDESSPNQGKYIGADRAANKRAIENTKPSIFSGFVEWVQSFFIKPSK